jgi:hypothetical protein
MRGRSDLVAVFDWLRNNGVEKIMKVIVIDDTQPSHSDSSIEAALKGFEVEVWDWKRPDLSTEVIGNSTKYVREISLYSTGNNAVLLGWVSPRGGLLDEGMFPMVSWLLAPQPCTEVWAANIPSNSFKWLSFSFKRYEKRAPIQMGRSKLITPRV